MSKVYYRSYAWKRCAIYPEGLEVKVRQFRSPILRGKSRLMVRVQTLLTSLEDIPQEVHLYTKCLAWQDGSKTIPKNPRGGQGSQTNLL